MFSKRRTYLDWAASAPVSHDALRAFTAAAVLPGNPSSPHEEGLKAHELLEEARTRIARLASVKSTAVIFTAGATEANAIAIQGFVQKKIQEGADPANLHVLYLPTAHASTRGAIELLRARGVTCEALPVQDFALDLDATKKLLKPETVLIAAELVCGETGVRFPVRDLKRLVDAAGLKTQLHVDASQAPLEESIELTRLGADTLSLDAQKVGGVRGIGVLIAPKLSSLSPLIQGGGQEQGLRPGTESPALAVSFATALEACDWKEFSEQAAKQRKNLFARISAGIPDVVINEGKENAAHILNISLPGEDTDYLVALMNEAGIALSTKSACETDELGSRVIETFTKDSARALATLRISWGPTTKDRELQRCAEELIRAVRFVRGNGV